ncbi:hypothetical protein P7C73_g3476, partial [Tremellales sp. Uapishka_1]
MLPRSALARSSSALGAIVSRRAVLLSQHVARPSTSVSQNVALLNQVSCSRSLAARCYSAASAQLASQPEAEEDDDFFVPELSTSTPSEPPSSTHSSTPSSTPSTEPPAAPVKQLTPFTSLKGRINHDTMKALTVRPFKLTAMSEVQRRVLGLMPELSGGQPKGEAKISEDGDTAVEGEKRGREDLLVKAKTGTGKTIAFLVPAIEARLNTLAEMIKPHGGASSSLGGEQLRKLSRSTVGTLIISPTRELATQIANEALKLTTHQKGFEVRLLVGGGNRRGQLKDWDRGRKDIVVATPGRLRDLLKEDSVRDALAQSDMSVLDEADTLLEMGFSDDLNFILSHLSPKRQTFLFSATVSPAIAAIARKSLDSNHKVIDCVPKNESNVHLHIPQYYTLLPSAKEQLPHILKLIAHDQLLNPNSKVIVFLPTTKLTMLYATLVRELGNSLPQPINVYEIHSKLDQDKRSRSSERFRRDKSPSSVLITSDVSARGVDYPGVTRVIQVGIPGSAEQYIHRVGRTGRGGTEGGRGDLVLLPWEMGFLTWQLTKIPIKANPIETFDQELTSLASPSEATTLAEIQEKVDQLMPSLDSEAVSEVFTSLLGYYLGKSPELRCSSSVILEGLKDWSVQAAGLPEPPHLSQSFLAKLGFKDGRTSAGRFGTRTKSGSDWAPRASKGFGVRSGGSEGGWGGRGGGGGGDRPRSNWSDRSAAGGERDGGFVRRDRGSGFGGGEREGGFRSGGGDREGGFKRAGGGDRDGGFRGGFAARGSEGGFKPRF